MGEIYGSRGSSYWRVYMTYSTSQTNTSYSITANLYLHWSKHHNHNTSLDTFKLTSTNFSAASFTRKGDVEKDSGYNLYIGSITCSYTRKTSAYNVTIGASITHSSSGPTGTSTASVTFSVPKLASYTVKYNARSGESNFPAAQTKYYGITLKLSTTKPTKSGYSFKGWATSSSSTSVSYNAGQNYTGNAALNLYAVWQAANPPTCSYTQVTDKTEYDFLENFSTLKVDISNLYKFTGRSVTVTLTIGSQSISRSDNGELAIAVTAAGTFTPRITLTDSAQATTTYYLDEITVRPATWTTTVQVDDQLFPDVDRNGFAVMTLEKWNYDTSSWDKVGEKVTPVGENGDWSFGTTLAKKYVDPNERTSTTATGQVKLTYNHTDIPEKEYNKAFYATTRNANFSNGLANIVCVSGTPHEGFSSRVWWSHVNDPLYFPDTNYAEVGSNDTQVMGLTKVGDYLGVVKQSKTTDTAIYLMFPTSFEDDTTFAVKQGVQGVGALGKYTFNILGDESLFLSPQGVMAIQPLQDDEHKVVNRSYFVDKEIANEEGKDGAYSFVFDGKYYLAFPNGHCYVLDGNQRNSWGNDKTNLVYECYFLTNIPATCLVKYNDELWFSDDANLYRFKDDTDIDAYVDGFDMESGDVDTPVKAEWSTILDDDGSLHYYKTMQKKGNLVSILPNDRQSSYVAVIIDEDTFNDNKTDYFTFDGETYTRCTEDSVFEYVFTEIAIDEETFDEEKTRYYILSGDEYVQCTEDSEFDPAETYYAKFGTYYVEYHSGTKVFVVKDDKDEVEIERSFSIASDIPSEMFLKKKFKKYKRLQFIIRNEAPEPFGVDSIVKNYTVGNYAKK